jgi:glycosyltransferase involved in cell wall biosynthesis
MTSKNNITIIIPVLNEEEAIAKVLEDIPWNIVKEVVVVDNGSIDRTGEVAKRGGAKVIFEPLRGYGSACLAGMKYLEKSPPEIVVFIDGDYSDNPGDLERFVNPILKEDFDFVIGSRILGEREKGALPVHSVFANKIFAKLVRVIYDLRLSDIGSYKAIRYSSLKSLEMNDEGYGFPIEMVVKSAKKKLRILEIPMNYRKRIGTSKVTGNLTASIKAGVKIFYIIFKYSLKSVKGFENGYHKEKNS